MIERYGKVVVSEPEVLITEFTFAEISLPEAQILALEWAAGRIAAALAEARKEKP